MNADSLLLDSNIIVHVLQGHHSLAQEQEGKQLFVSVVSRIELLSWPGADSDRDNWVEGFLSECELVELDRSIQDRTIALRKKFKLPMADAIIAATALHKDITLITADKGFKKVDSELRVIMVQP